MNVAMLLPWNIAYSVSGGKSDGTYVCCRKEQFTVMRYSVDSCPHVHHAGHASDVAIRTTAIPRKSTS